MKCWHEVLMRWCDEKVSITYHKTRTFQNKWHKACHTRHEATNTTKASTSLASCAMPIPNWCIKPRLKDARATKDCIHSPVTVMSAVLRYLALLHGLLSKNDAKATNIAGWCKWLFKMTWYKCSSCSGYMSFNIFTIKISWIFLNHRWLLSARVPEKELGNQQKRETPWYFLHSSSFIYIPILYYAYFESKNSNSTKCCHVANAAS